MKKKKKKWNPDRILFTFKTRQSAKKHILFAKWKYKHQETKSTHAFFSDQKVKAHTPTFILFVKLCKKPIKKKMTLAVLLHWGSLS